LKTEVRPALKKLQEEHCPIELTTISIVDASLKKISFDAEPLSSAPKKISAWIKNFALEFEWIESFRINPEIPRDFPIANYTMDGVLDQYDAECGHHHRFLIQTCFDNRQAIGTNLLKFEMAKKQFCRTERHKVLPIIVCADSDVLKIYKWDNSVASSSEYELALRSAYKDILDVTPVLIILCK